MKLPDKIGSEIDEIATSIYLMKEQLEHKLPAHKHQKSQLSVIEGGVAYLRIDDRQYYIPTRHFVWIPKDLLHHIKFNSGTLIIRNIYFMDEDDNKHPFYGRLGIYPVTNLLNEMIELSVNWEGNISPGSWEHEFLSALKHTLPHISKNPFSIQLPATENRRLQDIADYLYQNSHTNLNLPDIALQFGFSVRNLTRLFKQNLEVSFLEYIKMARIIKAMGLLLETDLNISEVAYEVGYSSIAAFSNTFQQLANMRPSDFQMLK
jgi:AraC-like DNA-binding protein